MIISGRVPQKELMEIELNSLMELVTDVVSNDYESYPMILEECQKLVGASEELPSVEAITLAIKDALTLGLIHAYRYSELRQAYVRQHLPADQIDSEALLPLYFYASEEGRQLLN